MKKILTLALFAIFAIVACDKDEENENASKNDGNNVKISLLKSDAENGEICIRIERLGEEKDSCFSIGRPFVSATVVVGEIHVTVGEGENAHDSVIYVYESTSREEPDYTWDTVTERIGDHDTTYTIPIPKK